MRLRLLAARIPFLALNISCSLGAAGRCLMNPAAQHQAVLQKLLEVHNALQQNPLVFNVICMFEYAGAAASIATQLG